MPFYLDIGAQRVQEWILATPELKKLRGASKALKEVTHINTLQEWLESDLPTCAIETGPNGKDGVVVLTCPDEQTARKAATILQGHLAAALPRVQWGGWWAEADTYLEAHVKADRGDGVHRFTAYPALYDLPVLDHCVTCRQEPRSPDTKDTSSEEEDTPPGADCAARHGYAKTDSDLPRVPGHGPADFEELSRQGGLAEGADKKRALGRRDSRNHLALIKADGNKIGHLFAALAEHTDRLPSLAQSAVQDLNDATLNAVEEAGRHPQVSDVGAEVKAVLPHYVGGDDVLVSVPAAVAWRFATELGWEFDRLRSTWESRLQDDLASAPNPQLEATMKDLIGQVSLGIGMVIAHSSHPIADSNAVAEQALRAAKLSTGGSQSAIAWVDLTAEGVAGAQRHGQWRQVISVHDARAELDGTASINSALSAGARVLFRVPPAGRSRLAQELRDAATPAGRRDVAIDWCKSTQHEDDALMTLANEHTDALLPLLSRARWWPTAALQGDER